MSIWDVLVQALFYAVPIIYPISMVANTSEIAAKIILLNPIAQSIQDIRYNLITNASITTWNYVDNPLLVAIPIILVVLVLVFATIFFRKRSKYFPEEV
jgi:ABC-2 type transport system permease protein